MSGSIAQAAVQVNSVFDGRGDQIHSTANVSIVVNDPSWNVDLVALERVYGNSDQ